jgi:hypothetical protein
MRGTAEREPDAQARRVRPVGVREFVVYTPWDQQTMVSHASGG